MSEIKKKYNHLATESEFLKKNYFQKFFTTKQDTTKREKVITQLPITISKEISGCTISGLIKEDIIATYQIMKGIKTKLLPIFDTEEKNIHTKSYKNILIKTGIFFDIDTDNLVYSERNTNFVRNLFVELVQKGNIYENCSINYRSLEEQKTLSTDEIFQKKMQTKQYNLRYFVDTKNISLIVPTLRPETIFADVALAIHPDDKRYKKLLKNKVIIPIINRAIPIIADESINTMEGTGIMRITPTHDKKSLIIAQKHGLQTDNFAIDKNGNFTKSAGNFCGKKVSEFTKNIIKNLDDIHNLESTKYVETEVAVHKKTNEKARPMLCNQLFIQTEEEIKQIEEAMQKKEINIFPEEQEETIKNMIKNIEYRPVTKEDSKGYSLPLWKSKNGKKYFISDNEILNLPTKKTKNKLMVLSLIIFNLITDGRLKEHFSIEECIDVLLGKSRTGEQSTLETYIELFSETLPRGYSKEFNELRKIIEHTQKDITATKGKTIHQMEKCSTILINILEKSIAISNKKKGFYSFDIDILVHNDEGLIQQKENIEETLGHALIMMKMMKSFDDNKIKPEKRIYIQEERIFELIKTMIIGYTIEGKNIFNHCYIQKNTKENKETYQELIKTFGTDCIRLYATNPDKELIEYKGFINKLRNASRFVGQHLYKKKGTRKISDFSQLTRYLEKRMTSLSEFELWIMYKTRELQKEYEEAMEKNTLYEIQNKMITMIKEDFCDKYLEIQKYQETENGNKVIVWCLGNILQLLHPFIPFISQKIREHLGFEGPIIKQKIEIQDNTITKNYKTQIFMDIIDKFIRMKHTYEYSKHKEIEICFFAPLDFLQYLREKEKILYKLINVSAIEYLENEKELTKYHTENIINITIGIKPQDKQLTTQHKKEDIYEALRIKEQEIQSIRTLIPNLLANNVDPEIIKDKKKEIIKLKKNIEELQYKLQRQKASK